MAAASARRSSARGGPSGLASFLRDAAGNAAFHGNNSLDRHRAQQTRGAGRRGRHRDRRGLAIFVVRGLTGRQLDACARSDAVLTKPGVGSHEPVTLKRLKIHEILDWPELLVRVLPAARRRRPRRRSRQTLLELEPLRPSYVSVTYGAGGTTRERTHEIVVAHQPRDVDDRDGAPHVRGAHTRRARRDRRPLPRRGDREHPRPRRRPAGRPRPPARRAAATRSSSCELVREVGDFSVGVAAHPEPHPRSPSREQRPAAHRREARARPTSRSRSSSSTPRHYFDLVESLRRARRRQAGDPRDHAGDEPRQHQAHGRDAGLGVPGVAGREAHAVGDDPRRCGAVGIEEATKLCARAARRRRAGPALLHAEPVDRDPGDLREPRAQRKVDLHPT